MRVVWGAALRGILGERIAAYQPRSIEEERERDMRAADAAVKAHLRRQADLKSGDWRRR